MERRFELVADQLRDTGGGLEFLDVVDQLDQHPLPVVGLAEEAPIDPACQLPPETQAEDRDARSNTDTPTWSTAAGRSAGHDARARRRPDLQSAAPAGSRSAFLARRYCSPRRTTKVMSKTWCLMIA